MTLQIVNGIHLPARDTHFTERVRNSPLLYGRGTYQLEKLLAGLKQCKHFDVAVDVGANVGLWTRILSRYFREVIAIEPIPENIDCMMYNLNDCHNVKINVMAVSRETGYLPLEYMDNVASASVCKEFPLADAYISCKPLDDFDIQNVSFIKIDVEGFENNVVLSGEETIRRDRPVIVVEQKKRTLKYDEYKLAAVRTLCGWGMTIAWKMFGDYCLVWR